MPNNPASPGPPQKVVLVPQPGGQWMVQQNNGPPENPGNATISIPEGTGPTQFTVSIAGNPANIKFKANNALSVWTGDKTAPQQGINSTQILGPILAKDGSLVFYDLNQGDAVKLNYAIHFEGSTPSVDPIIDNGGGVGGVIDPGDGGRFGPGGGGLENMLANINILLVGATLIALIAGFAIGRFWR